MRTLLLQSIHDLSACLQQLATARRPFGALIVTVVALVVSWFVYVPIHELLHVAGCVVTGGSVTELEIQPQYGGKILAEYFDFVVSGGEYAGRLSGFDTKGSDLVYLATDFMPYVLSILIGVPLIKAAARKRRPVRFGLGIVVGLAPLYNLLGDYYEMGSTVVTRVVTMIGRTSSIAFEGIRSDDVFKLAGDLISQPNSIGLEGAGTIAAAAVLMVVSFVVGIVLALATYSIGHFLWGWVLPTPTFEDIARVAPETRAK